MAVATDRGIGVGEGTSQPVSPHRSKPDQNHVERCNGRGALLEACHARVVGDPDMVRSTSVIRKIPPAWPTEK
jgi:hypothetical protein